jgi:Flp pilus assembly protein TadB
MVTAALAGALIGMGLVVAAAAARGAHAVQSPPAPRAMSLDAISSGRLARVGAAVAAAVVALAATGWPAAALVAGLCGAWLPSLVSGRRHHVDERALIEAIAAWTEMLRDAVASGRGVQEAIAVTASLAPEAVRSATMTLRARSVRGPLAPALRAFADEVGDPMADLVAATLTLAATREVRELADLLGALARTTRQRAALRLAAEAGRAGMRTTARAIVGVTVALLLGLVTLQPAYLAPYATPVGQLVAVAAGAWFVLGFWGLARLGRPPASRRLHLREVRS